MPRSPAAQMKAFWDARAREDAVFFVDNREPYRGADLERFWRRGREDLDRLLDHAGATVRPTDVVLELGCGLGRMTRVLAERAERVIALDASGEMLRRARRLNPELEGVHWLEGDGVTLQPVADGAVDVVLSHVVFQHIPHAQVTLGYVREIARVLADGGRAVLQLSDNPRVHGESATPGWLREATAILSRRPRGQGHPAWRGSPSNVATVCTEAADAGLAVERVTNRGTQFCVLTASRRPRAAT